MRFRAIFLKTCTSVFIPEYKCKMPISALSVVREGVVWDQTRPVTLSHLVFDNYSHSRDPGLSCLTPVTSHHSVPHQPHLLHRVPVRGDDRSVAAVERSGGTPPDGHPDVVLHLRSPGTAVEQVIVASPEHHPGRLGDESLLQQVLQAALQEFHWRPLKQSTVRPEPGPAQSPAWKYIPLE